MTPLLATEPPLYVNSCNACVCTYKLKSFNLCTHTRAYIYFTRYRWLGGIRLISCAILKKIQNES